MLLPKLRLPSRLSGFIVPQADKVPMFLSREAKVGEQWQGQDMASDVNC